MKIISPRGHKDYYDYLSGIYGEDEKAVFDRRQFTILASSDLPYFTKQRLEKDVPLHEEKFYTWRRLHQPMERHLIGTEFYCVLEIGLKWYLFYINRYLDKEGEVNLDWTIEAQQNVKKHIGPTPLTFYKYGGYHYRHWRREWTEEIKVEEKDAIPNPILDGTPIASLIPAQEIYDALYSYISSLNDVEIADNRNDVQKAESHGFDKKTSFRNIK